MQRSGGVGVPHTLVNRCCPPPLLAHTSSHLQQAGQHEEQLCGLHPRRLRHCQHHTQCLHVVGLQGRNGGSTSGEKVWVGGGGRGGGVPGVGDSSLTTHTLIEV